jgi:hypothetical protein
MGSATRIYAAPALAEEKANESFDGLNVDPSSLTCSVVPRCGQSTVIVKVTDAAAWTILAQR